MATINNTELLLNLRNKAKVINAEAVASQLAEKIVPVLEVNPKPTVKIISGVANDSASTTLMTTSTTKNTYLVGALVSVAKDVNATSLWSQIAGTQEGGTSQPIVIVRYEPLTAGQHTEKIVFNNHIKLEKGSGVLLNNSTAVGSIDSSGIVYYYEED